MTEPTARGTFRPSIQFSVERQRNDRGPELTTLRLEVAGVVSDDDLVQIVGDELARAAARQKGATS